MTTRNLHITIFEQPVGGRRGRRRGGSGLDPEASQVTPDPDDPESSQVTPDPDDPEASQVTPDPDDPAGGGSFHAVQGAPGALVWAQHHPAAATSHPCCCSPCCEEKGGPPEHPCAGPGDSSGFVIVRLARGVGPLAVESLWELAEEAGLEALQAVLALPLGGEEEPEEEAGGRRRGRGRGPWRRWLGKVEEGKPHDEEGRPLPEPAGTFVSRPLIQLPCRDRKSTVHAIECLEEITASTRFRPRHGLARYWRVDLRPFPELLEEVVERFNDLAEVDLAYRELRALDTAVETGAATGVDLADDQGYLDPAPVGIGARWLWSHLAEAIQEKGDEAALTVVDLEQGWTVGHRELQESLKRSDLLVHGENRADDDAGAGNHGTAVLGQLAAAGAGALRVRGSAVGIAEFRLASHYRERIAKPTRDNPFPGTNGHVASAIVSCLIGSDQVPSLLGKGDVLLLEVQRGRLPTETDEADFDAIRLATALGVVVVEAAGNGSFDLDRCGDPQTGRSLRRGASGFVDSGAILVGASYSELPHDRAPFSNYGSRIDCYGWGEGVTTCGYGDLHDGGGDREQFYTNTFNGTSSAAPVIAGAAALVQGLHLVRTGRPLQPAPLRALLSSRATGTPQGSNVGGHIGVMPNLEALVRGALQLVPEPYFRRHPCDDGSPPGPEETISSSPDVVVLEKAPARPQEALGEGSASAHHPAPGETRTDGGRLYVRLRNRGLAAGDAHVLLYASPAATLISPDAWTFVASRTIDRLAAGDTLQVSEVADWKAQAFPVPEPDWPADAVRAYSFLAVLAGDGGPPPGPGRALPPGPPYFDWRRYREFLRGPGVAWRNVHPVPPGPAASLAFYLAGTPDRARELDLEVVQRLPTGATVELHLPWALAAKLHQRQSGLQHHEGVLTLPARRSTRFSRVRLPHGLRAPARFEVATADGAPLGEGHSLALRQLWRGEEVGRITWYATRGTP